MSLNISLIFLKNKKIFLHNHSNQFRKFIINKIFLFNLHRMLQFHQLSQYGPLWKFSPLIQDPVQSHLLYLVTVSFNLLLSRTFQPFLVCHDTDIFEEPGQLHSFYLAITRYIAQFSVIITEISYV